MGFPTQHIMSLNMGPWFEMDPPWVLTDALPNQTTSIIAWFCENNSISISSLSVLAPAAPFAPPPRGGCALSTLLLSL